MMLVPPGKASKLLNDHRIYTGKPHKSEPAQEKWFRQTIHTYKPYWFAWVVIFTKNMLSISPIKWRQRPNMTTVVDWDVKHQFEQTNKFG